MIYHAGSANEDRAICGVKRFSKPNIHVIPVTEFMFIVFKSNFTHCVNCVSKLTAKNDKEKA